MRGHSCRMPARTKELSLLSDSRKPLGSGSNQDRSSVAPGRASPAHVPRPPGPPPAPSATAWSANGLQDRTQCPWYSARTHGIIGGIWEQAYDRGASTTAPETLSGNLSHRGERAACLWDAGHADAIPARALSVKRITPLDVGLESEPRGGRRRVMPATPVRSHQRRREPRRGAISRRCGAPRLLPHPCSLCGDRMPANGIRWRKPPETAPGGPGERVA